MVGNQSLYGLPLSRVEIGIVATDETTKDFIRKLLQSLVEWTLRISDRQEMKKSQ